MTRWKITIEYDGTDFCGWQRQNAAKPSVQQVIEDAVTSFSAENVTLFAAGRTDRGVHAKGQAAHFDIDKDIDEHTVEEAINFYVRPFRVSILSAEKVTEDFHARFSAVKRCYEYLIINRKAPLTYQKNYALHVPYNLDEKIMQEAADMLLGNHDFSTFRASGCQAKSPVKTLDRLDVTRVDDKIYIYTEARSFLYHQVRNMVGTLCMAGSEKWTLSQFADAFHAADRTKGGATVGAEGLYFIGARY
ncbi:MAG: tRNA pseudouridine(38-40) synthase TruA [Alphaproteobacteria bacterium]|nr:tRNA pseudouridine(38-40) synthase TruA [Alphaproteobacteria bacterium]MCL2505716.1 tRNA pseudouridine(38-40) synthase TruA [Alphaproteobacteria bacterium]